MSMFAKVAAVVVAIVGLSGAAALADSRPAQTNQAKAPQGMTIEELGQLLQSVGLNPEPLKDDTGQTVGYRFDIKQRGLEGRFVATLVANGTHGEVFTSFGKVTDLSAGPPAVRAKRRAA